MKTLGMIIREYRQEHNLSLREFATRCQLSHSYIDKLEKGIDLRNGKPVEPTLTVIEQIAKAINKEKTNLLEEIGYLNDHDQSKKAEVVDRDFEKTLNDPELGLWFKDIKDASPDKQEELRQFWEFIKNKEKNRKPEDKQK
ncbi:MULTISPECIES: helix-turn-helix domain-containing protein [unclassified Bacillus (in: firmicutes)]|uniref:helix-turn-helix domain-containing protein n=1 Tax=Bacillus TaxID=1386 RepID=UPI00032F60D0|nr:hypothetical protein IKQ_03380 [Bacillus cereus VDM053]